MVLNDVKCFVVEVYKVLKMIIWLVVFVYDESYVWS